MRGMNGGRGGAFDSSRRVGKTPSKISFGGSHSKPGNDATTTKNLTYDDVKALSDEYMLPCKNIYELHAEFNSLMSVAKAEKKQKASDTDDEH